MVQGVFLRVSTGYSKNKWVVNNSSGKVFGIQIKKSTDGNI